MLNLTKIKKDKEIKELALQCEETRKYLKNNILEIIKIIGNIELANNISQFKENDADESKSGTT